MSFPETSPAQQYTRALLATTTTLLELEQGVRVFRVLEGELREVVYAPTTIPYVFYEVSLDGAGSWWIPVGTEPEAQWQGSVPLVASGEIPTTHVLRPPSLVWWIPSQVLEPDLSTEDVFGEVIGNWPQGAPAPAKP